jgi:hypothetical protein
LELDQAGVGRRVEPQGLKILPQVNGPFLYYHYRYSIILVLEVAVRVVLVALAATGMLATFELDRKK